MNARRSSTGWSSISNVIVGFDGRGPSLAAARWAVVLADGLDAKVGLVAAVTPSYIEMPPEQAESYLDAERDRLAALARAHGWEHVDVDVAEGDAADVLPRFAEHADLMVIGSHATVGITKLGLGSLAHSLAHHSACPLVVVPEASGALADGSPIVIGIDGSEGNRVAFGWARGLARELGVELTAVFVTNPMYDTFDSAGWYGREEVEARAEVDTAPTVRFVERDGPHPAHTLEAVARESGAALLVVGARSRRALDGLVLGAVPDELLHHPTCPIAVVTHEFEEERSDLAERS